MRLLLTNDDGIRAPGIVAMYNALANVGLDFGGPMANLILPIAPLTVQSATSHGVTFHEPLMTQEVQVTESMQGVAVDGRPADCVKLALSTLWPERFGKGAKPDLVISGMNAGANCGINVIYSGTVAAALEAAFLGVPSIAVSLMIGNGRPRFDVAAARARRTIERILARGMLEPHECLSINLPVTESEGPMPEVKVCEMNTHGLVDSYEPRISPRGEPYYWSTGQGLDFRDTVPGSDVDLLRKGMITVTPLWYDLTRHESIGRWRSRLA